MNLERYSEQEFLKAEFPDGEPILDGLLYKGQNTLFVAPWKSAKTMFSLQLALSVAHGLPFLGKWQPPSVLKVLFIACEGTNDELQSMMKRQRRAMGIETDEGSLIMVRTPYLYINTPAGEGTLRSLVKIEAPDLLILDPFYRIHKGSVNDDDTVNNTTAVLNDLGQEYGHATWMPHHEHREKYNRDGMAYENSETRYAGSWALAAWCSAMFGFRFSMKKKTAQFSSYMERRPRLGDPVALSLQDTEEELLFQVGLVERLVVDIAQAPERLFGKSMREAAADYGQNHETFRKVLMELQQRGLLMLIPGGPGKETRIGALP